jgi:purine-nucleoside/S-methyl-5'-thioadenosine phosphorylase / adenosine deaminase
MGTLVTVFYALTVADCEDDFNLQKPGNPNFPLVLYWCLAQESFALISRHGLEWLECSPLQSQPSILHAFTTRRERTSESSYRDFTHGLSEAGSSFQPARRRLRAALGAEEFQTALLHQIHSSTIFRVTRGKSQGELEYRVPGKGLVQFPPAGDALLTDEPGILLEVRVADCMPILIADPRRRAVAAVHAGWRGALGGIIERAAVEMQRTFRSRADELLAAIGPSIRACCYEVGEEVIAAFRGRFPSAEKFFRPAGSKVRLDLLTVAVDELTSAGLLPTNLYATEFCTACRTDLFFSYRKEGSAAGRMAAVIGIKPEN